MGRTQASAKLVIGLICAAHLCLIRLDNCAAQTLKFTESFTGFENPVDIVSQDESLYIVELLGDIYKVPDISKDSSIYIGTIPNVNDTVANGVYGIAFHPEFPDSNYIYVRYTYDTTYFDSRLSRFILSDDSLHADSEYILLSYDNLSWFHQGGNPIFGEDGYIYVPTGDGDENHLPKVNGQDPATIRGNILRLDVGRDDFPADPLKNYGIPVDNPYVDSVLILDEIYAYGFRNPWRVSQDTTGEILIGEVGWNSREEVNVLVKGGNYGWPCYEGTLRHIMYDCYDSTNLVFPIIENEHDLSSSVTGGYVYRGSKYPSWYGKYFYGDFRERRVCIWDGVDSHCWDRTNFNQDSRIVTFGQDHNYELYVSSYDDGIIYRLDTTNYNCTNSLNLQSSSLDSITYTAEFIHLDVDSISNSFFGIDEMEIYGDRIYPPFEVYLDGCTKRKFGRKL